MKLAGLLTVTLFLLYSSVSLSKERPSITKNKQVMTFKVDGHGNEIKTYTTYNSNKDIYEVMISVMFNFRISESNFDQFLTDDFNKESIIICGEKNKVNQASISSIYMKASGDYGLTGKISCK